MSCNSDSLSAEPQQARFAIENQGSLREVKSYSNEHIFLFPRIFQRLDKREYR